MIKAYLDTNVLVDYFAQRQNFFIDATTIVSLAINKKIKLYVAALSFATASYLMEKHYHNNTAAIKLAISSFIKYCDVTVVDRTTIETSIASAFEDFEDGMQNACAVECKADYIVTRNVDDFEASTLKVVTPTEFLNILIFPPSIQ